MANLLDTTLEIGRRALAALKVTPAEDAAAASKVFAFIEQAVQATAEDRSRIQKLIDFFEGDQVRGTGLNSGTEYIPSWPDEDASDKATRADRMENLTWNRIRDGVLTHADALYAWGHGQSVHRRVTWNDEESDGTEAESADRKWIEDLFARIWDTNEYALWMWNLWAKVGAESRAIVMHSWVDASKRRLDVFPPGTPYKQQRRDGVVWSEILSNLQTIAIPNARQTRELGAVIRWYADPDAPNTYGGIIAPSPGNRDTITELVTDTLWLRFRGRELIPHPWDNRNLYGDVRTLFTWVRNPADIADSEDALSMQIMLLEDIYNGSEIKRSHAFPEVLYVGYDPPTRMVNGKKVLARGPTVGHIAPDKGADIKKVGPPAKVGEIGISQGDIHQAMDEAMGLSAIERSSEGLGQIRSAPGIGRMQAKSERRRRRKMIAAEKAERDMFVGQRDMALFHAFPEEDRADMHACTLTIKFPDAAFTEDPYTAAQTDQIEVTAGLESRSEKVRARHPEFTEEEVEARVKEIEKDMEKTQTAGKKTDPSAQGRSLAQESAK